MVKSLQVLWQATVGRLLKLIVTVPIKLYQKVISPLLGPRCRYYPSCSAYSLQAVETHGAVKGILLASGRILRCHPWSAGGIDPIPVKGSWRSSKVIEVSTNQDRQAGLE